MTPYHFALLRYVHDAAGQEFANIGLAMWLPESGRLLFAIHDRYARLSQFFSEFDGVAYRQMTRMFEARLRHVQRLLEQGGRLFDRRPESIRDVLESVLASDSSSFQWSAPMGGVAPDASARLSELLEEFVTRHDPMQARRRRDETEIWSSLDSALHRRGLSAHLQYGFELAGRAYSYRFRTAWMNGTRQVLEPISLDYLNRGEIVEKANTWSGRLLNLAKDQQFQLTGVVAPPRNPDLQAAYEQAVAMLREAPNVRAVVPEDRVETILEEIERDLAHH